MGNTMIDLITLGWEQFVAIYILGETFGIASVKYLIVAILIFGILRSIHKYAAGDSIGLPAHSAWILRCVDWFMIKIGWAVETNFLDNNLKLIPVGFNLLGILIDASITGAFFLLLLFIWPGILLITITFVPLQGCRNRNIRKKKFIAKLKGIETK